jgi:phage terminase large subunit-like protein
MRAGPKAEPRTSKLPALRSKTPARRVEEFARRFLTHVKGEWAGRPFLFTAWQRRDILEPVFNTLVDGRRQYRTVYITCPRKQGKTTVGAALALYMLYADGEPGAEIVSAAASRDQAAICFTIARQMVEASPALRDMTQVFQRELVVPSTGSRYRVIPADAPTAHGFNLSGAIIDELHAHHDRRLYDALTTATGARRQPLTVILTTAGTDEHSIAAEVQRYAEQVRAGVIVDASFLPVVYAAPPDADPWDEAVWRACNPALASGFRSLEEMQTAARQAKDVPGREPAFRQLYLNQWGTASASRWLPLDRWDACASVQEAPGASRDGGAAMSVPPPGHANRAFLGLDLSTTTDLTALAVLLPDADGGYDVRAEFWCPADYIAARSRRDRVPYELWATQGHLTPTPGNTVDYSFIEARIHALMREYDVVELGCDPWNARGLVTKLQQDGVPAVEVPQTMANLTSASKALETLVLSGKLRHDGNPVMRWCVSNAVADVDANGNVKPSKKRSHERIDGVSAMVTALARALVHQGPSVYDHRPPLLVDL